MADPKLDFSSMNHGPEMAASLRSMLAQYSKGRRVDVGLHEMDYESGWSEFVRNAVHGSGPDVSEVGTTWLSDFMAMNALRPFSLDEVRRMGGSSAFVPALWQPSVGGGNEVYAIPWQTDVNLVYYRKDWLAKAGVDEATAFDTPEHFERTLSQLQASGVEIPWVMPTRRAYGMLHLLSMWLWHRGGDFLAPDGRSLWLNRPEFRAALRDYLRLFRYLHASVQYLTDTQSDGIFLQGKAAVTINGPWLISLSYQTPDLVANLGLAVPLGVPYVGGSSLVIWNYSKRALEAAELVAHLVSRSMQVVFPKLTGMLPARLDTLGAFAVPDPALTPVISSALQLGRSFPAVGLWGTIEDRLVSMLARLSADLLAKPDTDLDALIDEHLPAVISRLNLAFT